MATAAAEITKQKVKTALSSLGKSHKQIVASLAERGISGKPTKCPLVVFLATELEIAQSDKTGFVVDGTHASFWNGNMNRRHNYTIKDGQFVYPEPAAKVALNAAQSNFTCMVDGDYAGLDSKKNADLIKTYKKVRGRWGNGN